MKALLGLAPLVVLAAQFDYIRFDSPRSNSNVLIVEGRRAADCAVAEVHRGRAKVRVPNLMASENCRARVAVFTTSHAAQLIPSDQIWTDAPGDVLRIKPQPRIQIPVHSWVLYDPCSEESCTNADRAWSQQRVKTYMERANSIWGNARSGLIFENVAVADRTRDPAARVAWDLGCTPEGDAARTAIGRAPNAINVYYVRETGPRGMWCEPDTILINANAYDSTLAHEFGHALALTHTEHIRGIHEDNLMNTSGAMRTLTLGQLFRANFSAGSIVNRLHLRSGPVVDCAEEPVADDICPALTLDLRRPPR